MFQSGFATIRSKLRSVTSPQAESQFIIGFGVAAIDGYEANALALAPNH
jgi:hypothetical protein